MVSARTHTRFSPQQLADASTRLVDTPARYMSISASSTLSSRLR